LTVIEPEVPVNRFGPPVLLPDGDVPRFAATDPVGVDALKVLVPLGTAEVGVATAVMLRVAVPPSALEIKAEA